MTPGLPSDFHEVVGLHKHGTTLYVLAGGRPCIDWRDHVCGHFPKPRRPEYGRLVVCDRLDQAPRLRLPESWAMALLLCSNDDLGPVLPWARRLSAKDRHRIQIFLHPDTPESALQPWNENVDPEARARIITSPARLVHAVATHLNNVIYADHAPSPVRGLPP